MIDLENGVMRLVRGGNDLTARQLGVLFRCSAAGPVTVRALAEYLDISKPAVSRAVDRLAAAGYAGRKDDPTDRRSVLVDLTRDGRVFLEKLCADTPSKRKAA